MSRIKRYYHQELEATSKRVQSFDMSRFPDPIAFLINPSQYKVGDWLINSSTDEVWKITNIKPQGDDFLLFLVSYDGLTGSQILESSVNKSIFDYYKMDEMTDELLEASPDGRVEMDDLDEDKCIVNPGVMQKPGCEHSNKYINKSMLTHFWVCPDCREDLGDVGSKFNEYGVDVLTLKYF